MTILKSRRRGGAKATLSLPTEPTPGQLALLAEFRAVRDRVEKLVGRAYWLGIYRSHLPEVTILRYYGFCFWYAELLLGHVRADEDAFLELDWPVPDGSPCLVLRRRARVIDMMPFLRALKPVR
ncbi:hypothetical protein [Sorangium sp. So ce1151]|uniref:hypothetical protein n=1 Tax=Sorangium sp. So ce1151 TaxID=3133332 RepID=UPI003F62665D